MLVRVRDFVATHASLFPESTLAAGSCAAIGDAVKQLTKYTGSKVMSHARQRQDEDGRASGAAERAPGDQPDRTRHRRAGTGVPEQIPDAASSTGAGPGDTCAVVCSVCRAARGAVHRPRDA